ncbi:hypothetical protein LbFV_ORF23 [Leptopilina boulardi filamentous virus]|uniref:Uncharacterized protein n=1 Tax=Leptopilina boulardi filamentous virus TaxID=552509 RepID=A0A1S5YD27_9VIRU|nr:hypothetical protein LbFV_ORF23 [Leptopilina boulardi filamentous virus]AQQ79943.1 hypothetical protein LbFV_ORF23 [Leptopilina boulardi filamentous virus]
MDSKYNLLNPNCSNIKKHVMILSFVIVIVSILLTINYIRITTSISTAILSVFLITVSLLLAYSTWKMPKPFSCEE